MAKEKITCPICNKADQVIPIIYGFPSEELFKQAEKGLCSLGGCIIEDSNPNWHCKRDNFNF